MRISIKKPQLVYLVALGIVGIILVGLFLVQNSQAARLDSHEKQLDFIKTALELNKKPKGYTATSEHFQSSAIYEDDSYKLDAVYTREGKEVRVKLVDKVGYISEDGRSWFKLALPTTSINPPSSPQYSELIILSSAVESNNQSGLQTYRYEGVNSCGNQQCHRFTHEFQLNINGMETTGEASFLIGADDFLIYEYFKNGIATKVTYDTFSIEPPVEFVTLDEASTLQKVQELSTILNN